MVQIHLCEPPGDILVFLTGEEEIEDACRKITKEVTQAGDQVPHLFLVRSIMHACSCLPRCRCHAGPHHALCAVPWSKYGLDCGGWL